MCAHTDVHKDTMELNVMMLSVMILMGIEMTGMMMYIVEIKSPLICAGIA